MNFDKVIEMIWTMTPIEKKQLIADLDGKVSPKILDEIKTICALSDQKVREAMFNQLWAEAHPTN